MLLALVCCATGLISCTAGASPPAGCQTTTFTIQPIATRQSDPDLLQPAVPPAGGDNTSYCPTPSLAAIIAVDPPTGFTTTEVSNLSLDIADQALADVAMGNDMMALAWTTRRSLLPCERVPYVRLTPGL